MTESNIVPVVPQAPSIAERVDTERAKVFGAYGAVALAAADLLEWTTDTDRDGDIVIGALEGARDALRSASCGLWQLGYELGGASKDAESASEETPGDQVLDLCNQIEECANDLPWGNLPEDPDSESNAELSEAARYLTIALTRMDAVKRREVARAEASGALETAPVSIERTRAEVSRG